MSKPIKLTPELRQQAIDEFSEALVKMKMSDGKVSYNKNFTYKGEQKAKILFTPTAYAKMISLLMAFESEVAWHGVGERTSEGVFVISDILVYPQTVSGTTVEMDTEKYAKWLMDNDGDERFDHIIMQGHSHVRMSTSPSAVDKTHQEAILDQLRDNKYYIFTIWNKSLEHTTKIYDVGNNILYENDDIEYGIVDSDCDLDGFIKEAKEIVVSSTAYGRTYNGYNYGGYETSGDRGTTYGKGKAKKKGKSDIGNGWQQRGLYAMDDDAEGFFST